VVNIQDFLQLMLEAGASDLHVTQDSPPLIRVHGELKPLAYPPLTATDTRQLCYSILTESQKKKFEEDSELDFSFAAKGCAASAAISISRRVPSAAPSAPFRTRSRPSKNSDCRAP